MLPRRLCVLVVDDDADGAELLAVLLRQSGCDARFACTAEEAVAAADAFAPDVLILDPSLPGIDGGATARRLRDASDRPLLVAVTGAPEPEAPPLPGEFDHHFPKPVTPESLIGLLKRHAAAPPARRRRVRFVRSEATEPLAEFRWPLLASMRTVNGREGRDGSGAGGELRPSD